MLFRSGLTPEPGVFFRFWGTVGTISEVGGFPKTHAKLGRPDGDEESGEEKDPIHHLDRDRPSV